MTSRWLGEWIKPLWDLMHLNGNRRYSLKLLQDGWRTPGLWRSEVLLRDQSLNIEESGMAEGSSWPLTRLRAAAEAYEKICHRSAVESGRLHRNEEMSFGYGVSNNSKTAILRARAEYFERMHAQRMTENLRVKEGQISQEIQTADGSIWIAAVRQGEIFGTGYGLNQKQALDSAQRSLQRKKDFPSVMHSFAFQFTDQEPEIIRLTPERPWLECYFCGHTRK